MPSSATPSFIYMGSCGRLFHLHSNLRSILSRLLIDISIGEIWT